MFADCVVARVYGDDIVVRFGRDILLIEPEHTVADVTLAGYVAFGIGNGNVVITFSSCQHDLDYISSFFLYGEVDKLALACFGDLV